MVYRCFLDLRSLGDDFDVVPNKGIEALLVFRWVGVRNPANGERFAYEFAAVDPFFLGCFAASVYFEIRTIGLLS